MPISLDEADNDFTIRSYSKTASGCDKLDFRSRLNSFSEHEQCEKGRDKYQVCVCVSFIILLLLCMSAMHE